MAISHQYLTSGFEFSKVLGFDIFKFFGFRFFGFGKMPQVWIGFTSSGKPNPPLIFTWNHEIFSFFSSIRKRKKEEEEQDSNSLLISLPLVSNNKSNIVPDFESPMITAWHHDLTTSRSLDQLDLKDHRDLGMYTSKWYFLYPLHTTNLLP